jgi:DNA-directed RNA polymerase II subunit RPB1
LDTEGIALQAVLSCPEVDHTRTTCNHIGEIKKVLGLEAARNVLLKELRSIISYDGSYVNYRHLSMLADIMTYQGYLLPIRKYDRMECGPLMKSPPIGTTEEIFLDAAMYAERDDMKGVNDNIILGQLIPLGTGIFDLYM